MSTTIRLSSAELKELIGSSRKKVQIEWLSYRGWRFDLDVNDRPIVMRSFVEHRLGVSAKNNQSTTDTRPRFDLLPG
jgi:Domain of unknown function (DUF4224)